MFDVRWVLLEEFPSVKCVLVSFGNLKKTFVDLSLRKEVIGTKDNLKLNGAVK